MNPPAAGAEARAHAAERGVAAAVAVMAFVHTASLLPTLPALLAAVPPRAALGVWLLATTLATAVLACALGIFLVVRAGSRRDGVALALFLGLLAAAWGSVLRFASVQTNPDGTGTVSLQVGGVTGFTALAAYGLATAAFLRFTSVFPQPLAGETLGAGWRPLVRLRGWLLSPLVPWALGLSMAAVPVLVARAPGWFGVSMRPFMEELVQGRPNVPAVAMLGLVVLTAGVGPLALMALGTMNLVDGYRTSSPEARRRVLWLTAGCVLALWMLLAPLGGLALREAGLMVSMAVLMVAAVLAPLVLVVSTGMAVLYGGALDPALALRRSTVYGAAAALGLVTFAGLENVLSGWVASRLGLPGAVGSMIAGGVAAGVMLPFQAGIKRLARGWLASADGPSGTGSGSD